MKNAQVQRVSSLLKKHGGFFVHGDLCLDGESYDFRTVWNGDNDADSFIEELESRGHTVTAGKDSVKGIFTLWFSIESNLKFLYALSDSKTQ